MTNIEKIKQVLKEINEARKRATPGEWVVQQKSLSNFDHPYVFDRTYGAIFDPMASSTKLINRPNCDFICLSANKITSLTKALDVAVEALKKINNPDSWDYDDMAEEAINQVAEILGGE